MKYVLSMMGALVLACLAGLSQQFITYSKFLDLLGSQSVQSGPNHLAALLEVDSKCNLTLTPTGYLTRIANWSTGSQVRTTPLNRVFEYSQFVVFNRTIGCLYYEQNTKNMLVMKMSGSNKIIDLVFGSSYNQIFAILLQWMNGSLCYTVSRYSNRTGGAKKIIGNVSSSLKHDKTVYMLNKVYVLFEKYVVVYYYNGTAGVFEQVYTNNYYNGSASLLLSTTDMEVSGSGNLLYFSSHKMVHIYNLSSRALSIYDLIADVGLPATTNISSVQVVLNRFLLISTASSIYQYDVQIGRVVSSVGLLVSGSYVLSHIGLSRQIIVHPQRSPFSRLQVYTVNGSYKCNGTAPNGIANCSSCLITYNLNNFTKTCYKNYMSTYNMSQPAVGNQTVVEPLNQTNYDAFNMSANLTIVPSLHLNIVDASLNGTSNTVNTSINTSSSNSSFNSTSSIQPYAVLVPQSQLSSSHIVRLLNSETAKAAASVIGKSLTFTSLRITPKFLLSLTTFLDDLWYYQYHRTHYPQFMTYFMAKVDLINQLRRMPWFSDYLGNFANTFTNTDNAASSQQNGFYYSYLAYNGSDPQQVYFFNSTYDTYKSNLLMNLLMFLILKLVLLLALNLRYKHSFFQSIYSYLKVNTLWWTLFISVLQVNMVKLSFDCALQFNLPSSFQLVNKINFVCATSLFFGLIFYSICFYPLIYTYYQCKSSQILLTKCSYRFTSFFAQTFYIVFRNFIRSIMHGLFITNYQMQIFSLAAIDLPFFILALLMRKCFRNFFTYVMCILYSITFTIFDFYFYIELQHHNIKATIDRQLFVLFVVCLLVLFSLLISIGFVAVDLFTFLKDHIKKCIGNSIQPQIKIKNSKGSGNCMFNQEQLRLNNRVKRIMIKTNSNWKAINKYRSKSREQNFPKLDYKFSQSKIDTQKNKNQKTILCRATLSNNKKIKLQLVDKKLSNKKNNLQISCSSNASQNISYPRIGSNATNINNNKYQNFLSPAPQSNRENIDKNQIQQKNKLKNLQTLNPLSIVPYFQMNFSKVVKSQKNCKAQKNRMNITTFRSFNKANFSNKTITKTDQESIYEQLGKQFKENFDCPRQFKSTKNI